MKRRELLRASAVTLGAAFEASGFQESTKEKAQRLHMALMLLCMNKTTYGDFIGCYKSKDKKSPKPKDPNLIDIDNQNHPLFVEIRENLEKAEKTFRPVTVKNAKDLFLLFAVLADEVSGSNFGSGHDTAAYGGPATCPCSNQAKCPVAQRLI